MAASLPVIATSVGAAPEVIENGVNGYVIAPGDLHALREKIQKLADDHMLRIDMGTRNQRLCREKYSSEQVIRDLVADIEVII